METRKGGGRSTPKIERTQTIFCSPTSLPSAAFTNPFATPAQPQLPSTNPFQPNGLASGKSRAAFHHFREQSPLTLWLLLPKE